MPDEYGFKIFKPRHKVNTVTKDKPSIELRSEIAGIIIGALNIEGYSISLLPGDPEKQSAMLMLFPPDDADPRHFILEMWEKKDEGFS